MESMREIDNFRPLVFSRFWRFNILYILLTLSRKSLYTVIAVFIITERLKGRSVILYQNEDFGIS